MTRIRNPLRWLIDFLLSFKRILVLIAVATKKTLQRGFRFLGSFKRILVLIAVVAFMTVVVTTLVITSLSQLGIINISRILNFSSILNTSSIGTIRVTGVAAYGGDIRTTNGTNVVDWGTFYPGVSNNASFYLESISNIPVKLAYNVTDWSPESLVSYMTLTWNYNDTVILPHEQILINFTLSLSSSTDTINYLIDNNVTSFNFNINIYTLEP